MNSEDLQHIVNVLVSCKGCPNLKKVVDAVDNCKLSAHTFIVLGKIQWSGIPDRDKCPRMQEAWKTLQKAKIALKFVEHIEEHLKNDIQFSEHAKVMCKICNKTIDEIVKEESPKTQIEKLKQFCYWQGGCKEDYDEYGNQKSWTCTAHLHESRANKCPYKSFEDAKNHQCVDAKPPKEET